jgi:hypothetical protein
MEGVDVRRVGGCIPPQVGYKDMCRSVSWGCFSSSIHRASGFPFLFFSLLLPVPYWFISIRFWRETPLQWAETYVQPSWLQKPYWLPTGKDSGFSEQTKVMRFMNTLPVLVLATLLFPASKSQLFAGNGPLDNLLNPSESGDRVPPVLIPTKTTPWAVEAPTALPATQPVTPIANSRSPVRQGLLTPTGLPTLTQRPDQCRLSDNLSAGPDATANCAGKYHNPIATTISGPWGLLPTPKAFIRREGTLLKASSSTYRPVGPNMCAIEFFYSSYSFFGQYIMVWIGCRHQWWPTSSFF